MNHSFQHNTRFLQAVSFVNHTDKHIFLTGNAGTGKTTFLKYISKNCPKKMAIVAPTGVAAINAGGTTIHSLFWLPFGTYLADHDMSWDEQDNQIYNKKRLLGNLRFRKERRTLLQELDLLVIDEVSMLRADMLDAIDTILKSVRRDARPFGGLQVLFIGDLYQLPPVVKAHEWKLMQQTYKSPFFFDAHIMEEAQTIQLELTEVYRQRDDQFIDLLNSIRSNRCSPEQLRHLNSFYQPNFVPANGESYITLCSHNAQADKINKQKLAELEGKQVQLDASVSGNFSENAYPVEASLALKEGAQVMFIKNDKGEERRYYNGKIGIVKSISASVDEITIRFPEGTADVVVEKEKWENIQYFFDTEKDKICEEVLGTFRQFPLRLAWAVTIHKSQGLTFDHAIIDAGSSFAAGQVYVALSRLRSLKGLVLQSIIKADNIYTDHDVKRFSDNPIPPAQISEVLESAQRAYLMNILLDTFVWEKLISRSEAVLTDLRDRNIVDKGDAYLFIKSIGIATELHRDVANKFRNQLKRLVQDRDNIPYPKISERSIHAKEWFISKMDQQIIEPLTGHIQAWQIKKRSKKYLEGVNALLIEFKRKKEQIKQTCSLAETLAKGGTLQELLVKIEETATTEIASLTLVTKTKPAKGESGKISLSLFQKGKSIEEIAKERGLTEGTIQSHLISFIGSKLKATSLISADKLATVLKAIKENPEKNTTELKRLLGNQYSYADIRIGQMAGRKVQS